MSYRISVVQTDNDDQDEAPLYYQSHHEMRIVPPWPDRRHPWKEQHFLTEFDCTTKRIGPRHLQIYRDRLPDTLNDPDTFQALIDKCEIYAQKQQGHWETNLYSLTKQDIAVNLVPNADKLIARLQDYVLDSVKSLYHQKSIHIDANQPHVLKYDGQHRAVRLHHDRCDVTVNLMLSKPTDYSGGGTFFADLNQKILLDQGDFLIHPGCLIHGGCEITSGVRYLLVYFVHFDGSSYHLA